MPMAFAPSSGRDRKDMAEEKIPYAKMAIAVAVGIMVGALISSGDSDEVRKLNRRIAALEAGASEQVTALAEAVQPEAEAAPEAAAEAAPEAAAEVAPEAEVVAEAAPEAAPAADPEADAALAALNDRVTVLADQMGRLATALLSGSMPTPAAPAAGEAAPAEADAAAPDAAVAEEPAAEETAAAAEAPAAAEPAEAAEPGEVGLLLAVGDTGMVGDRRVFVSRIDVGREAVRLMVVGDGPRMLGRGYGPLDLGNGCTVELKGIVDRMALVVANCAG
jgi:hypothetical protein